MKELFINAVKNKYRYPFKGQITTEDLFDLKVEDLDVIYRTLNKQVKKEEEESLLSTNKEDKELQERIEIVKYVFNAKQDEAKERLLAAERKAKKEKILSIMAAKQDEALQNKSVEELASMLENL